MQIITGDELREYITSSAATHYKKRFCFAELQKYISYPDRKVMSIYGLRRTGKTVMMLQMIAKINNYNSTCLINCTNADDMQDLTDALDSHKHCKYFFIDEVTKLENFVDSSAILADIYAELMHKKIVITGTDSLGFKMAELDELFDRTYLLHTTYISFKEYNHLLGKGLDEYIEYGGTLTDGKTFYNKTDSNAFAYTNNAIAENIEHSLENSLARRKFHHVARLYDNYELTSFINRLVEMYSREIILRILNNPFKSQMLGLLRHNMASKKLLDTKPLKNNEPLRQEIMSALSIKESLKTEITTACVEQITNYLVALDVMCKIPSSDEIIFTQPGLRYAQASSATNILVSTATLDYSREERKLLTANLLNCVKGQLLEDIIFYQVMKDDNINSKYSIEKFSIFTGEVKGEFDITCIDKTDYSAIVFEIKHSSEKDESQARHLNNLDFCKEFENYIGGEQGIVAKAVIYMGATAKDKVFGVNYINAEDFLKDSVGTINHLLQPHRKFSH